MVNNSNFRIVAYGEILWDILPDGPVLGGALFNFTNRVNELGNEGILISKLGADNFGKDALEGMKKLHLDTSYIQRDLDHPTGTVKVTLDENHNPDYEIIKDVAYDFITTENRQKVLVSEADCLCFGYVDPTPKIFARYPVPTHRIVQWPLYFLRHQSQKRLLHRPDHPTFVTTCKHIEAEQG